MPRKIQKRACMRYFLVLALCVLPLLALQSKQAREHNGAQKRNEAQNGAHNEARDSAKNRAIARALELELHNQKQWRDLLHFDGKESEIVSPEFFYAKDGGKDAKAELIATIEAFYQSIDSIIVPEDFIERVSKSNALLDAAVTSLPRRSSSSEDYHGICRFPARFFYLHSLLDFEELPHVECQEFRAMFAYVNPKSATLIFPAAHINSPASMFGHTFLLLNSGFNSRLLSFAINYQASADPNVENGFAFARRPVDGVPGRTFAITAVERFEGKTLRRTLRGKGAELFLRGFPLSAPEIYSRTGMHAGSELRLAFTRIGAKAWMIRLGEEVN